jgi:hypothetical protein
MASLFVRVFLFPGEAISNLLGARGEEDRIMVRTLINMLFWNAVIVLGAVIVFI